jgi:hypothetical protein
VESILRLGKPAGELGPSTIVGSAAYNLMMISAVCTVALPTGESSMRRRGWFAVKHAVHLLSYAPVGAAQERVATAACLFSQCRHPS